MPNSNLQIWKGSNRGITQTSWLLSKHSFSFGGYYSPDRTGFSDLLVINDDIVAPKKGFATHGHRNMEIISYVLSGSLHHKDSMGKDYIINAGEIQVMSAGTGITHSEYNPSDNEPVHFFQMWVAPAINNITPNYEQKYFPHENRVDNFQLVASPNNSNGSLQINQDAYLYIASITGDKNINYTVKKERVVYIHIAKGNVSLNGALLEEGDGVSVASDIDLNFSDGKAEVILFDLSRK